ncbi:NACHT domain-containing protein [Sphingosinithalassobacter portus]|uniref:NACHT domain-containing protein n=1 Tax=Stakelama portus TaxID=2676234 RepID=UPI00137AAEA1|nr:NACHT domain-containing protein [Sphingosinithalassobacter portus]
MFILSALVSRAWVAIMISSGTLLKLTAPAVQQGASLIFQKIARLRRIKDAISDQHVDDMLTAAASDFVIVKGSWLGEYDERVAGFLSALSASGLHSAMFNDALVGARSPAIKAAFVALFEREVDAQAGEALAIYNEVATSYEITTTQISKDPVLARIVKQSNQFIIDRIAEIESSIDSIRVGISRPIESKCLGEIIPRLLRAMANDTRFIRVETSQGRKEVEVSKIYIAPKLSLRNHEDIRPAIDEMLGIESSHSASVKVKRLLQADRTQVEQFANVSIDEITGLHRVVVLGNPGGGKSTLLQAICHNLGSHSLKLINDGAAAASVVVPIRIVLRDFERARLNNAQLSILEYITNELLSFAYTDKNVLMAVVERLLASGQAYLAFDGLDEILKTANRRTFVDLGREPINWARRTMPS